MVTHYNCKGGGRSLERPFAVPPVMRLSLWLLLLTGYGAADVDWSQIPTPPVFYHVHNEPILYYTLDSKTITEAHLENLKERTLRCAARGNPPPRYEWRKDDKPFLLDMYQGRVAKVPGEGSFVFSKLTESDQGVYQCFAINDNGTALSEKVKLEHTWINRFEPLPPETVEVELGGSYSRNCTPPDSNPKPRVYWILKGNEEGVFDSINASHISSNEQVRLIV
uniref:Ig-like domain-containing protein n=1 Tax=Panagrolaimus superbus TaxID=310955 RepID=A0A914Y4T3_9BILA